MKEKSRHPGFENEPVIKGWVYNLALGVQFKNQNKVRLWLGKYFLAYKILITFYVLFSLFLEWIGRGTAELTCCLNRPCRHGSCPRWWQGKEGEGKFLSPFIREHGTVSRGFPGGSVDKESACNAGDPHLIPRLGRSPEEGNGNLLQYSYLENPKDRGAWWATVHGVMRVRYDLVTKSPKCPDINGWQERRQYILVWTWT